MAMGSTGTVNITPEMMTNALSVIEDYEATTNGYRQELANTVNTLIPGSFSGNAADGFKYFYTNKIDPIVGDDGLTKIITALKQMVQGILDSIPGANGLDDQLGDGNKQ